MSLELPPPHKKRLENGRIWYELEHDDFHHLEEVSYSRDVDEQGNSLIDKDNAMTMYRCIMCKEVLGERVTDYCTEPECAAIIADFHLLLTLSGATAPDIGNIYLGSRPKDWLATPEALDAALAEVAERVENRRAQCETKGGT